MLSGSIEHVVFHNSENGFCVLRVQARGHRDLQAVVGRAPAVAAGQWITASGQWENDRAHGPQFSARYIRVSEPSSVDGIEKYLGSGALPGIGPAYAKKLVRAFADKVFDVIDHEPERLQDVPGIGPVRASRILAAWSEQKVVREIMVFLHSHGVGAARAYRIFKKYGADAVRVMSENPYRLARDIHGIGFTVADGIAMRTGIKKDAEVRIRAGIGYALREATNDGHCGVPHEELLERTQKLLDVPVDLVNPALEAELEEGSVIADHSEGRQCVFLKGLYRAEESIATALVGLARGDPPWPPVESDHALSGVERALGLKLAPSQLEAVRTALRSKVTVITGGPGVGKTTIVNAILRILESKNIEIALAAPTGRAAKRLGETTGKEAKTIHRLLEFDPGRRQFRRDSGNPLECALLVVDEMSMVDVPLMNSLLKALREETSLLLVGDVDQLPSVGPGQVLGDLINSGAFPVVRLVEVFRQAARSKIVVNAHRVNKGDLPDLGKPDGLSDFYFVPAEDPAAATRKTLELVRNRIPKAFGMDPLREVQVLSPMNRGAMGARAINVELQAALNPDATARVERFGRIFAKGDKVMQTENDYDKDVYNGDIGFITLVDQDEGVLEVNFDGRVVEYTLREIDALLPAYAITIHKSQGSEYPAVVIPVLSAHFVMLQRNLIYTAITRGKRLVVLVGQRQAIKRAVDTNSDARRCSKLREWILRAAGSETAAFAAAPGRPLRRGPLSSGLSQPTVLEAKRAVAERGER